MEVSLMSHFFCSTMICSSKSNNFLLFSSKINELHLLPLINFVIVQSYCKVDQIF